MAGIHGNQGCIRCGKCCVYFEVRESYIPQDALVMIGQLPERVFKKAGEPCPSLRYDPKTNIATCIEHDCERRHACQSFSCSDDSSWTNKKANWDGLRSTDVAAVVSACSA